MHARAVAAVRTLIDKETAAFVNLRNTVGDYPNNYESVLLCEQEARLNALQDAVAAIEAIDAEESDTATWQRAMRNPDVHCG